MTREQKIVLAGAAGGVIVMVAAMALLAHLISPPVGAETLEGRLAAALRWDAVAALPFFAMLAAVGNARFTSDAIDPTRGVEDRKTMINGRVADNTAQQLLLFLAGTLGLAASLPPDLMSLIPAAAIVFVAARMLFWIGYRIDPLYRAFGFSSTAYLNLGLLVGSLWFWLA